MNIYQTLKNTFLITFFLLLAFFLLAIWRLNSSLDNGCLRIHEIALDTAKVEYLDSWAMQYVVDKGFNSVNGMHGDIMGSKNNKYFQITPLPAFEKTGIETKYLRFSVGKKLGDFETPITSENVGQFEFGDGRNQVIILKNGVNLNSYGGQNQSSGHLLKISETTFAYCADSTFEI